MVVYVKMKHLQEASGKQMENTSVWKKTLRPISNI